jgi:predicted transcriptional regulator of viral defense system
MAHRKPFRRKPSPLLKLARARGVFTVREAGRAGVHSQSITRLLEKGVIERVARGHYQLSELPVTEHHALAMAARAAPRGVICLLSALAFHGIGTQVPADVWIAIPRASRAPAGTKLPLRIIRVSGAAFTEGIEQRRIEGHPVRVYSVARTLADLFKYRNRVGLEVALEALREAWRDKRFTMEALDRAARACRVERVMRPYIEAVVS